MSQRYIRHLESGFTYIELLVVVGITAILSAIVIANMKQNEQARSVNAAADSMSSALRLMQSNILSGLPHTSGQPARDWGFQINTTQTRYQTFVEEAGPSNKQFVETYNFPNKVVYASVVVGGQATTNLEVRFFSPFGEIRMTGGSYTEAKNLMATVVIQYQGTSRTKTIIIDGISGRIQVQ